MTTNFSPGHTEPPYNHPSNAVNLSETFSKFFEHWLTEQARDLQSLRSAAAAHPQDGESPADERRTRSLIQRVLSHYENYYRVKHASATHNVLPMFSPSWTSSTENLFLWVGGWRPSMAFQLLYSKSGTQVESQLTELIRGLATGDLADLSRSQMDRIDKVQRQTIREEREITEELAAVQESVADTKMVELTHAITEGGDGEEMKEELGKKREKMQKVLDKADKLRLETLKRVVEVLKPMQAIHFLIAAAELHLRIHEFGKQQDEGVRACSL